MINPNAKLANSQQQTTFDKVGRMLKIIFGTLLMVSIVLLLFGFSVRDNPFPGSRILGAEIFANLFVPLFFINFLIWGFFFVTKKKNILFGILFLVVTIAVVLLTYIYFSNNFPYYYRNGLMDNVLRK